MGLCLHLKFEICNLKFFSVAGAPLFAGLAKSGTLSPLSEMIVIPLALTNEGSDARFLHPARFAGRGICSPASPFVPPVYPEERRVSRRRLCLVLALDCTGAPSFASFRKVGSCFCIQRLNGSRRPSPPGCQPHKNQRLDDFSVCQKNDFLPAFPVRSSHRRRNPGVSDDLRCERFRSLWVVLTVPFGSPLVIRTASRIM